MFSTGKMKYVEFLNRVRTRNVSTRTGSWTNRRSHKVLPYVLEFYLSSVLDHSRTLHVHVVVNFYTCFFNMIFLRTNVMKIFANCLFIFKRLFLCKYYSYCYIRQKKNKNGTLTKTFFADSDLSGWLR